MHRSADQVRGGLVAGKQQQEHHRHDFVAADLPAILFDAHDLGDQPFTAALPHGLEMPFDVAPHRQHVRDHEQEAQARR